MSRPLCGAGSTLSRTTTTRAGYALQAPGFYAYDGGERYDGTALGELLRGVKAEGTRVEWNLHDVDVHVACDQAWAAWVNSGAGGKPGAMQPVTWLESMVLRYQAGRLADRVPALRPRAPACLVGPGLCTHKIS